MVFPGVIRRFNKNLAPILQVILIICIIHYFSQGMMTRIQRKLHIGRFSRFSAPQSNNNIPQTMEKIAKKAFGNVHKTTAARTTTTTTAPPPPPPDEFMAKEQQKRINILQSACKKWGLGKWENSGVQLSEEDTKLVSMLPKMPLYQALLVSEQLHFAFCPVVRTGASWVAKRLLEMTGQHTPTSVLHLSQPPLVIARHQYAYLSSWERYPQVLSDSVNFLVVRHPLDRLLASYRHLLEDAEKSSHGYLKYGRRIVRMHRKAPAASKEPTFEEFIRFILDQDVKYLDEAWQPISRRCTPCHIPYSNIAHHETLWNDAIWIWKHSSFGPLNTTDYVRYWLTRETRHHYFSELTVQQIFQLHHMYRLDFDMFGYTIEEHLSYARPGDEPVDPALLAGLTQVKYNSDSEINGNPQVEPSSQHNHQLQHPGIQMFHNISSSPLSESSNQPKSDQHHLENYSHDINNNLHREEVIENNG